MKSPQFKKVSIDAEVADTPIGRRYAQYAAEAGVDLETLDGADGDIHEGHTLSSGKREVHVTRFQGAAVKQCTGLEEHYVCCNLHVMNQTTNCPLDCSYCILQAYINRPVTTVHANVDEMVNEAATKAAEQPGRLFRIGTGDLGDALALDPLGGVASELILRFAEIPNVVLELKTKSNAVEQLIGLRHGGRTVVAWSMNTPAVIASDEHLCASLDERLEAASKVIEDGYLVAFHFDPMIVHDGFESEYPEVVRRIFETVPSDRIAWLSMGSLRFPPSMAKTMAQRFPKSKLLTGELLLGNDGKMRYLRPFRLKLYRTLYAALGRYGGSDVFTYMCMEAPEVWRRVMGDAPESNNALDFAFSTSLVRRFPYLMPTAPGWDDYAHAKNLSLPA
jgi:spore photoproduct lyase